MAIFSSMFSVLSIMNNRQFIARKSREKEIIICNRVIYVYSDDMTNTKDFIAKLGGPAAVFDHLKSVGNKCLHVQTVTNWYRMDVPHKYRPTLAFMAIAKGLKDEDIPEEILLYIQLSRP